MELTSAIRGCNIRAMLSQPLLNEALDLLGQALTERGLGYELVAVGGTLHRPFDRCLWEP